MDTPGCVTPGAHEMCTIAIGLQIRAQLGDIPDVLDTMDWQLNAGAAQALRQL